MQIFPACDNLDLSKDSDRSTKHNAFHVISNFLLGREPEYPMEYNQTWQEGEYLSC